MLLLAHQQRKALRLQWRMGHRKAVQLQIKLKIDGHKKKTLRIYRTSLRLLNQNLK